MNAPFPIPAEGRKLEEPDVWEPLQVQTDYIDGASTIRVLPDGSSHMILWRHHLNFDGDMERVVAARLVMSREVMREIADRMLTETMVATHHRDRAAEERRRRMD